MKVLNRFEVGTVLVGLFAVITVLYSLWLNTTTMNELMPLIQISNDLKVKVSSAHLWFEEAIQGDATVNLQEQVYANVDLSIRLVRQQQNQMEKTDLRLFNQSRQSLNDLVQALYQWRSQTTSRWNDRIHSGAGTKSDTQYDASFAGILDMCDQNQRNVEALVSQRQTMLLRLHITLITFLVLMFSALIIIFVRDRRAMEKKNLALLKLSQAIEQTDDMVTVTDHKGLIEYVNPSFEKFTGYSRKEISGMKPSVLKSGKHAPEFYEDLWEMISAGKVFRSEFINKKKDGSLYYEEKTISPIRDTAGNITHYVSTAKDITERKLMEKELAQSREMKLLGQITSGVAHEVRNPLNAILAISEAMFQDFSENQEYAEYLDRIRKQVNRLSVLMNDLLELGKPIPPAGMRITPPEKLCSSAIDLWKQYHKDSDKKIVFVDGVLNNGIMFYVHRGKLQQVLINLLDNAAQHSPVNGEIEMILQNAEDGLVHISIHDQGPGVEQKNLLQMFEPFFTTRTSGTGLGLSIVKHIVEMHGGTVVARNRNPGPGLSVEIQIPASKRGNDETQDFVD
jgi:PAS domain S-box-containing protein